MGRINVTSNLYIARSLAHMALLRGRGRFLRRSLPLLRRRCRKHWEEKRRCIQAFWDEGGRNSPRPSKWLPFVSL